MGTPSIAALDAKGATEPRLQASRTSELAHRHSARPTWLDDRYVGLCLLVFVCGAYSLLLVQSFFPVTEGWFQDYSNYMSHGAVMYRDFYMFIPPGFPWLMHILGVATGNSFLAFRLYGVTEGLVLVSVVYLLMLRLFSTRVAFFSVLSSFIVYTSNLQDVFYGYYQSSLLLAVLALYFMVKWLDALPSTRKRYPILFGLTSGALLLFEVQMVIYIMAIGLLAVVTLLRIDRDRAIRETATAVLSLLIVLAVVGAILASNRALIPAVTQVVGSSSSKGGMQTVLLGFLGTVPPPAFALVLGTLGVTAILSIATRARAAYGQQSLYYRTACLAAYLAAGSLFLVALWWPTQAALANLSLLQTYPPLAWLLIGGLIFVGLIAEKVTIERPGPYVRMFALALASILTVFLFVYVRFFAFTYIDYASMRTERQYFLYAAFGLLALFCAYAVLQLVRRTGGDYRLKVTFGVAALALMYIHALSGVISDHAILLGGSLLIGNALAISIPWPRVRDNAVYVGSALVLFAIVVQRNALPYYWWGVHALPPTWTATTPFEDPLLHGIYGEARYVKAMNAIYEVVESNKEPGDTLYSFPSINYFNVMSGLPSPTFGKVDYFDVAPDWVAIRDARLLITHPPAFVVWMEFTPEEWEIHETLFRGGRQSGQREIEKAFRRMVSFGSYVHLGRYYLAGSDPIDIYLLRDGRAMRFGQTKRGT